MKTSYLGLMLIYPIISGLTGCVSVQLPTKADLIRSDSVRLQEPNKPYRKVESRELDSLWTNSENGNSISYISDCKTKNDPPLETLAKGVLSSLDDYKITKQERTKYNQRAAILVEAIGEVDGVDAHLLINVFKKNSCIYVQTYVSYDKSFKEDLKHFKDFLSGFKVP